MATAFAPRGPHVDPEFCIDRTHILDPAKIWRDIATCPDWPALRPSERYAGPRGKAGAEARLEAIGVALNRGPGKLKVPTADDRDAEFSRVFRRTGSTWHHLGIHELSPLGMLAENDATLIVEACHIRGFLMKLETREAEAVADKEQRRLSAARRTLENWRTISAARTAEIEELAEAAARHQQRIDDEAAYARRLDLVASLSGGHLEAVKAAHELGLSVPDAPSFVI